MPTIPAATVRAKLEDAPELKEKLYVNGFLISDCRYPTINDYPFYNNWVCYSINRFSLYAQKNTNLSLLQSGANCFFMIGHAVDPFENSFNEKEILETLSKAWDISVEEYYNAQNSLTGVYCTGVITENELFVSNDCAGMQIVYYGSDGEHIYVSSHSKLVGDLAGLDYDPYIERLVQSKFYHYMGTWLPGDCSPYKELKRLVPNHYLHFNFLKACDVVRFFPQKPITENYDESSYNKTIMDLSDILHKTLKLYGKKWNNRKVAISVTGGRDSTTTLACANGLYDQFSYFSYVSNEPERIDAVAAQKICGSLGLDHQTYIIPNNNEGLHNFDAFSIVLECNAGCIGRNNPNDIRKRLYFIQNPKYDVEIKSWVNELGRGSQYTKYNKKRFPKKPTASYCRALHKIYLSPRLIHETDKVFSSYLKRFYPSDVLKRAPWMELFWWEFCWSGGEGIFLTAEQRTSSEITIPYNNRRIIAEMLTVPLEKRRRDSIPIDIIQHMNPRIAKTGVVIKDLEHTDKRALLMRLYLEIFSRIRF